MSVYHYNLSYDAIVPIRRTFATEEGASNVFHGVVRELEQGKPLTAIAYSVYPQMAEAELERMLQVGQSLHDTHRVWITHRLGEVALGEISIEIAVHSKHSVQAFQITQWYLQEIKAKLPIWKRFIWSDSPSIG